MLIPKWPFRVVTLLVYLASSYSGAASPGAISDLSGPKAGVSRSNYLRLLPEGRAGGLEWPGPPSPSDGLKVNGYWFSYGGKPIYLIGNGMESIYTNPSVLNSADSLDRWVEYLDLLAAYKVNLVRFYSWAFVWDDLTPWHGASPWTYTSLRPVGYDVESFSQPYWNTVTAIAKAAADRGIIFQYILFEGWMTGNLWQRNPWNIEVGGPLSDAGEFFDLAVERNRYQQEKYVQKAIDELGSLPNVLFEIANELVPNPFSRDWVTHWVTYIKSRAPGLVLTISQPSWRFGPEMATEGYWELSGIDFISPHETNGAIALYDDYLSKHFLEYWEGNLNKPMIVGEWCGVGESLGYADERKLFWTALASGGHGSRSCWPLFQKTPALPWLRNMADFLDGTTLGRPVGFDLMRPLHTLAQLQDLPDGYQALTMADTGKEYLVYIRAPQGYQELVDGGRLELTLPSGKYTSVWYDPKSGAILNIEPLSVSGPSVTLPVFLHREDVVLYLVVESYLL